MSKIKEFFQNLVKAGTIPQEPTNYDAETLKIYIDHLEADNAALRERLEKAVDKEQIAKLLAGMFGCPCNYCPLDEEMYEYCDECGMDNVVCWEKVIDKKSARLAELKGGQE